MTLCSIYFEGSWLPIVRGMSAGAQGGLPTCRGGGSPTRPLELGASAPAEGENTGSPTPTLVVYAYTVFFTTRSYNGTQAASPCTGIQLSRRYTHSYADAPANCPSVCPGSL